MTTEQRIAQLEKENTALRSQIIEYQDREKAAKDAAEVAAAEEKQIHALFERGLSREQAIQKIERQRKFDAGKKRSK